MSYNAKEPRNKRRLRTRQVLDRMFGDRSRKPCAYCGKLLFRHQATFDHVVPLSSGGYDKGKNGVIACAKCNMKKASKSVEQFKKSTLEKQQRSDHGEIK